jgi:DNA-binding CsgD family transcriptional regulator
MDDIHDAIANAWRNVHPKLLANPSELARRLARHESSLLTSPPRAWCLAVRASDRRLDGHTFNHPHPPTSAAALATVTHPIEQVVLTSELLRRVCAPVQLASPGEPLADVAQKLGMTPCNLLGARLAGRFNTHHVPALNGHWGKPHPILYTRDPLDPGARQLRGPDPAWSTTSPFAFRRIPSRIRQTLTRVPLFVPRGPDYRDKTNLHPEHPDVDFLAPSRKRRSQKLPPPEPDPVSYKWKDGVFLGYDWRNPLAKIGYERHQRRLAMHRAAAKARRQRNPKPSKSAGSLLFHGWRWLCPHCGRAVNVLFLPLKRRHLLPGPIPMLPRAIKPAPVRCAQSPASTRQYPRVRGFACEKCHRIKRTSRCDPNAWNEIITYLSAGLLYGREVPRPDWFPRPKRVDRMTDQERAAAAVAAVIPPSHAQRPTLHPPRKLPYTPRPNRAPSQRRPEIEQRLLAGQSFQQIASDLHLVKGTVLWHAQQVYKQNHVRTLKELLRKHGQKVPPEPTIEIRRRLLAGQSIAQINADLHCGKTMIYNQRQQLRKKGMKLPDAREHNGGKRRCTKSQSMNIRGAVAPSTSTCMYDAKGGTPRATRRLDNPPLSADNLSR